MKRREVLALAPALCAGVVGGPAQALREGLRELGYAEGRNYRLVVRWGDNQLDRLPGLARELLALKPAVAVVSPVRAAQATHRESKVLPIVMAGGAGAQNFGLVASLAKPAGNVTGVTNMGDELTEKSVGDTDGPYR